MAKIQKKKNYKRNNSGFQSNKKSKKQKKVEKSKIDPKRRKFKYIQRSKEAEDAQRRQKLVEDKYKTKIKRKHQSDSDEDFYEDEEDSDHYSELLTAINQNKKDRKKPEAIESSSDESVEEEEEEHEDLEGSEKQSSLNDENIELDPSDDDTDEEEQQDEEADEETENESLSGEKSDAGEDEDLDEVGAEEESVDEDSSNDDMNESEISDEAVPINSEQEDPFALHLDKEMSQEHVDNLLQKTPIIKSYSLDWSKLGNMKIDISDVCKAMVQKGSAHQAKKIKMLDDDEQFASEGTVPKRINKSDLSEAYVKNQLISNMKTKQGDSLLTDFQSEMFSILNNYQDLYFPRRNFDNAEEIRYVYCLHALNHMLKTRSRIIHHNAKLAADKTKKLIPESYRDQGLIRPKILIVLPFRDAAFKVLDIIISLMFGEKSENAKKDGSVKNYKRFEDEFTGDTIKFPKTNPKPQDYERTFCGNTDDSFRLGISLTKKCIKLYQDFYASDIIIASPLGLRIIVGAAGDPERDFDFLNSIEILVLDQAELFFAQNWDHFLHVLDHLHLQPQSVQNTDFSRVRQWCLNGLSRFYRQTLLFTSHELPEFRSVFNNRCLNYRGKVKLVDPIEIGTIRNVATQVPQVFHKIEVTSIQTSFDTRFEYFKTEILPQFKGPSMAHCMIYVPSYFDFVRIRNYMKLENLNFSQICEYTKEGKVARARDMFFHSSAHFLLYSERAHFFKRTRVKGIRHLIMYQPPYWPNLYPEMINLMQTGYQNARDGLDSSMSITILFTKYDILQVANIIGTERASEVLRSGKTTHMFTTTND